MGTEFGAHCSRCRFYVCLGKDYDGKSLRRLRKIHPHRIIGFDEHDAEWERNFSLLLESSDGEYLVHPTTTRLQFETALVEAVAAFSYPVSTLLRDAFDPLMACRFCGHEGLSVRERTMSVLRRNGNWWEATAPFCAYHGQSDEEKVSMCIRAN